MPLVRLLLQPVAVSVLSTVFASAAQAYGPTGHRLVGMIAAEGLCPDAEVAVTSLLDDESLADAGLWADRIRSDPSWRRAAPWHYVNVADDAPIETATGGKRGDVLQAIARFQQEITDENLPVARRADALRFLVHFVADVHQPLHVGRADDRGGNRIAVTLNGKRSNLHQLWDGQALLRADRVERDYRVADQARAIRDLAGPDPETLQSASVLAWARESQELRHLVYAGVPPPGAAAFEPDADYLATAREITLSRLSLAAVRLAGVLNAAWCNSPEVP
jgi:hypothetical protein